MRFRKPHGIPHVEADTMFRYSFKILPDRLKLIRLYPCGSLGQSVSFVFGARVGHFAATPQSDVVGIWSRDLGVMATLSVRQKMPFFRAFITLRSQFHLHHRSQRALTEILSKITASLGLVLQAPHHRQTPPSVKSRPCFKNCLTLIMSDRRGPSPG